MRMLNLKMCGRASTKEIAYPNLKRCFEPTAACRFLVKEETLDFPVFINLATNNRASYHPGIPLAF
jgi:hypothetical protein